VRLASKLPFGKLATELAICIAIFSVGPNASAAEFSRAPTIERTSPDPLCGTQTTEERLDKICPRPERNIAAHTVNLLKRYLSYEQLNDNDLCSFELMLESAASYCQQGTFRQNHNRIANLLALAAMQWHERKDFGKANSAYQRALNLRTREEHPNWMIWLLQKWAFSRLEAGDSLGARQLSDSQVALADQFRQVDGSSRINTRALIVALRFQSEIYQAIGLTRESKEIAERMDELEAEMAR